MKTINQLSQRQGITCLLDRQVSPSQRHIIATLLLINTVILVASCEQSVYVPKSQRDDHKHSVGAPELGHRLSIQNNSEVNLEWGISKIYFQGGKRIREYIKEYQILNNKKSFKKAMIRYFYKSGYENIFSKHLPPPESMVYFIYHFRLRQNGKIKEFIAIGGTKADYQQYEEQKMIAHLQTTPEVLGYGYAFYPGNEVRKQLQLKEPAIEKIKRPDLYRKGVEIYTLLDQQKIPCVGHIEWSFYPEMARTLNLNLTITGTTKNDFVWSFTCDYPLPFDDATTDTTTTSQSNVNLPFPLSGSSY